MHGTEQAPQTGVDKVHLPKPTAWPMVLALGISLMIGGMITHEALTVLGVVLALLGVVGWFRNVLPHEEHEDVQVNVTASERALVAAVEPQAPPAQAASTVTYSFISGLEAGVAGGLVMALVSVIYSLTHFGSLWYGVNLLAASSFLAWSDATDSFLAAFHMEGLLVACGIHALVSVLVGLLYASVMPIFPRRALLTGGVLTPLVWTGLAWSLMSSVTPVLGARVNWIWFVFSQMAFGLTAVAVVNLRIRFRSAEFQKLSLNERAGLHSNQSASQTDDEVRS